MIMNDQHHQYNICIQYNTNTVPAESTGCSIDTKLYLIITMNNLLRN